MKITLICLLIKGIGDGKKDTIYKLFYLGKLLPS